MSQQVMTRCPLKDKISFIYFRDLYSIFHLADQPQKISVTQLCFVHHHTCCFLRSPLLLGLQALQVQFGFVLLILCLVMERRDKTFRFILYRYP